jgi:3-dehydroquinate synthase
MAANLSERLQWISKEDVQRTKELLSLANLPIYPPAEMGSKKFLDLMAVDKKVINSRLRLVLLEKMGNAIVTEEFDKDALNAMLSEIERKSLEEQITNLQSSA